MNLAGLTQAKVRVEVQEENKMDLSPVFIFQFTICRKVRR